ncbi:TPA: LPXTG cell wall anchor domain-containing protein [Streptococcus suis]|nr:LPXTG cell wall anchor domain-containing protein [Streptococcus suis]
MQVKKFAKWGLALTSTLVLGGVVTPASVSLLSAPVVYAQEAQAKFDTIVVSRQDENGNILDAAEFIRVYDGGDDIVFSEATVGGYEFVRAELIDTAKLSSTGVTFPYTHKYVGSESGYGTFSLITFYKPVETPTEKPVETPTEKPVEQPTEQPTEQPVEQPAETPTGKPVEQPADQPATPPTDQPVEQPISVAIIAISEADGPLSHYYVTINPGETKTVEAPKVDGYKLDQYAGPTYELTYDYALGLMNSGGSAWVQFWMIKDTAPETPVDQPVEQPAEKPVDQPVEQPVETPAGQPTETPATTPIAQPVETPSVEVPAEQPAEIPTEKPAEQSVEQPVETPAEKPVATPTEKPAEQPVSTPTDQPTEQPVEKPVETPTEKPTATSLLAGNTASKAQTGATADKKKVDNSTPSTNAVKSEEGSQATAKTLPKTGDSSSMLLVLGGLLSGLSGLGLAATSRKRD